MRYIGWMIAGLSLAILIVLMIRGQSALKNISSYRIYYGDMNNQILEDMKKYDMVVVEALKFDEQMVSDLKASGVKVIGYISVSEVGSWDDAVIDNLMLADYYHENGHILTNRQNRLGDLSSVGFRSVLLKTIENRIVSKGMDGVFFDTVETLDIISNEGERHLQALGYVELIEDIRLEWKNLILIQNRGFNYTYVLERGMIDAFLWENFNGDRIHEKLYMTRAKDLHRLRWIGKVRTMVLAYRNEDASRGAALRNHWIFSYLNGQDGLMEWDLSQE